MGSGISLVLAVAAPAECERVCSAFGVSEVPDPGRHAPIDDTLTLLATGVGPTAAGASAARYLATHQPACVVSLGIGGAFKDSGANVLDVVVSSQSILAGEGRVDSEGHHSLGSMGFGPFEGQDAAPTSPDLVSTLIGLADHTGPVATVSAASGTESLASTVGLRTGALAEAMEGAAVHLACERVRVPFAEVRVISNIVGDRHLHPWRLAEALDRLGPVAIDLALALRK